MIQIYTNIQLWTEDERISVSWCDVNTLAHAYLYHFHFTNFFATSFSPSLSRSASTLDCKYEKFSFLSKLCDTFMNWCVHAFAFKWNGMCVVLVHCIPQHRIPFELHHLRSIPFSHFCYAFRLAYSSAYKEYQCKILSLSGKRERDDGKRTGK